MELTYHDGILISQFEVLEGEKIWNVSSASNGMIDS